MNFDDHSIWLMPRHEDEVSLSNIVQELARRFGSPTFQPHLTLVEDMPRSCDELKPLLEDLADGEASFTSLVEALEGSPLYYRSFYARFSAVLPLRTLKKKAVDLFGIGSFEMFVPHISVAYGVPDSPEKTEAISALERQMKGLSITFDRICIVSSSQRTPIKEWKMKAVCYLS